MSRRMLERMLGLALLLVGHGLVGAKEIVEGLLDLAELEADLADLVEGHRLAQTVARLRASSRLRV